MSVLILVLIVLVLLLLAGVLWLQLQHKQVFLAMQAAQLSAPLLEEKHRHMLHDLHQGLSAQGDRLTHVQLEHSERLRQAISSELVHTRDALQNLQRQQNQALSDSREQVLLQLAQLAQSMQSKQDALKLALTGQVMQQLAEQNREDKLLLQKVMAGVGEQLSQSVQQLTQTVEQRLEGISGKVNERLEEGFKKTNDTFVNVMARLATIDEAQKKIDGLTSNVVTLQELLGDKRSRGAFGEVQLAGLVRNVLPEACFELQAVLSNGTRVDCLLRLPEPTGTIAVDSKFPLENYQRMLQLGLSAVDKKQAEMAFKADLKKHINDIASKYIIPNQTADGALMFVPAEAVFAEIHAYHPEIVAFAQQKRIWIVSPTTMMAVLNTARAVIKDVETRQQIHIIKDALGKLSKDFNRFDDRLKKLATHIRQAHEDALQVQISGEKISKQFTQIEQVQLDGISANSQPVDLLDGGDEG